MIQAYTTTKIYLQVATALHLASTPLVASAASAEAAEAAAASVPSVPPHQRSSSLSSPGDNPEKRRGGGRNPRQRSKGSAGSSGITSKSFRNASTSTAPVRFFFQAKGGK